MPAAPLIASALLLAPLDRLCKEPSLTGDHVALAQAAEVVRQLVSYHGLRTELIPTDGAPIILGYYDAHAQRTLLVYSHYDVAAIGDQPWTTDPFALTERDNVAYARGVVAKGELVAQLAALRVLIDHGLLKWNVCVVVEGEYLRGSPHLAAVAPKLPQFDAVLWGGGSLDATGRPLLYTGSKGLLQVELQVDGARLPLPAAYAGSTPHPIWTLTWALGSIKSQWEEILFDGFYDDVQPPGRAEMQALAELDVGEAARLEAWGIPRFVANLSGTMLPRTESFSPACNIGRIEMQGGDGYVIPQAASATLQFHLVPDQQPDAVWQLLQDHLEQRQFIGLTATRLPGGYAPRLAGLPSPLSVGAQLATERIYDAPGCLIALSPFPAPVSMLAPTASLIAVGLERPTSAIFGADERLPLADLERYAQFLAELLIQSA